MSAWWLPAMFFGVAALCAAVEYGALLGRVH
jgi:hypothetical protein